MYEAHYGLSATPFKLNPDPSFYFGSKQHSRARAYLEYGVSRNEGFIVITGEIGAGKTTVLRSLIDSLDGSNVVVGHLVTTQLDDQDVLRMVALSFGVTVKDTSKAALLANIEAFLISQVTQSKRCLLVVDEAQNLTSRAVEELRMLSNFQLGNESLLQSFLVGQPEFRQILQQPDMEQFRQRVAATCHIGPLDTEEVRAYVGHRLQAAGCSGKPTFDDDVYAVVMEATGGVPRRINTLMDRLLLSGYLNEATHFSAADAAAVARELREESAAPPSGMPQLVGTGAVHAARDSQAGSAIAPVAGDIPVLREVLSVGTRWTRLSASIGQGLEQRLGTAHVQSLSERMMRLEDALVRLERIQEQHVALLNDLVSALSAPPAADSSTAPAGEPAAAGGGTAVDTLPEARQA